MPKVSAVESKLDRSDARTLYLMCIIKVSTHEKEIVVANFPLHLPATPAES